MRIALQLGLCGCIDVLSWGERVSEEDLPRRWGLRVRDGSRPYVYTHIDVECGDNG